MKDEELIASYYSNFYSQTHYKGFTGIYTRGYHKLLERQLPKKVDSVVIEVGGGSGEHLDFLQKAFDRYIIIDPFPNKLIINKIAGEYKTSKVEFVTDVAERLPFESNFADRIIFTCVLLHLQESSKALSEARRVLKDGGNLSIYLPCDPGILYRFVRHFGSHLKQKKLTGKSMASIKYLWSLEHTGHVLGIQTQLKKIFENDDIRMRRYPFKFLSWNFNLFYIYQVEIKK
jgi:ubiquinone/menaquinone biosynthesis C-methylase UbiE